MDKLVTCGSAPRARCLQRSCAKTSIGVASAPIFVRARVEAVATPEFIEAQRGLGTKVARNERLVTLLLGKQGCDSAVAGITETGTRPARETYLPFRRIGVTNLSFLAATTHLKRGGAS